MQKDVYNKVNLAHGRRRTPEWIRLVVTLWLSTVPPAYQKPWYLAILLPCGNGTHQFSQSLDLIKTACGDCLRHLPSLSEHTVLWASVLQPVLSQHGLKLSPEGFTWPQFWTSPSIPVTLESSSQWSCSCNLHKPNKCVLLTSLLILAS